MGDDTHDVLNTQELLTQDLSSGGGTKLITFDGNSINIVDTKNLEFSTGTGSQIGTATAQKLAFWGVTPVVQPILATGAAATVDDVLTMLQAVGICKQA